MSTSQIPPPASSDHEEVHWALSTAQSLEAAGDHGEALRWVRRAVAAAVACDDDARAIELGRVAAAIEEGLGGAATQRGELDLPTYDDTASAPVAQPSTARDTARARDTSPDMPAFVDEEVTLVPFTMKAAGLDPGEVLRARRIARPRSEDATRRATSRATSSRDTPPQDPAPGPAAPGSRPAAHGEPPSRTPLDEEHTIASRVVRPSDLPAASSKTLPVVTRWRVALLATADDAPRVIYLGPGIDAPAGAAVAYLVPSTEEDARAVATLLGRRR